MNLHEVQRLPESIDRPSPTVFINVSPTISPKTTNSIRQDSVASFLAGIVIGLALALTYKGSDDRCHHD